MDEFPFSALFLFAQSCLTDAVNVIFSDYCFTDTYLRMAGHFFLWRRLMFSVLHRLNHNALRQTPPHYLGFLIAACAAANLAMGTRKGEQDT